MKTIRKSPSKSGGQSKKGSFESHKSVQHKPFMVGPVQTQTKDDIVTRMAIFIWGPATCGKSTLAATAPGHKLWLSFGDNEHVSVMRRSDVTVADLSGLSIEDLFKHGQNDNPFGLDQILAEQQHITTVVFDSATALTFRALQKVVRDGVGASKSFRPTMEAPGISAYGGRNAVVLEVLTGVLKVTAKYGVHIIITAHEADPHMRKENNVEIIDYITVMLGGQLVNGVTFRLSEIWYMSQETTTKQRRRIAVRPTRLRKPMKTRMFSGKDLPEFFLEYDAGKADEGQMTIAAFYDEWVAGGYVPIHVPNNMREDKK